MHLHILGICGTFMAGIALLARESGHRVTGSDAAAWPPMSTQLEEAGIEIFSGYRPENLDVAPDVVVVGNVVSRGNPEIEAVLDRGMPFVSGPQWLHEHVLRDRWVIAVAGTHGKTTTSSLVAWILEQAGLNPGFLIGGVPTGFGQSARLGSDPFFVVEADEYDTAFFDKRSKFVHYHPRTLVLNNLEFDHADIFADLAAIERQFHHLVRTVPSMGQLIVNAEESALGRVLEQGCWTPIERFGEGGDWCLSPSINDNSVSVVRPDGQQQRLEWAMTGAHNQANALAALLAARHVGVTPEMSVEALGRFPGVKRRQELRAEVGGVRLLDDFAHHPTAISLTLEGVRKSHSGRVIAALEPRSNTMRMGCHEASLRDSVVAADKTFVLNRPDLQFDAARVFGDAAIVCEDVNKLVSDIQNEVRPGDVIVGMSNGDFGGFYELMTDALEHSTEQKI